MFHLVATSDMLPCLTTTQVNFFNSVCINREWATLQFRTTFNASVPCSIRITPQVVCIYILKLCICEIMAIFTTYGYIEAFLKGVLIRFDFQIESFFWCGILTCIWDPTFSTRSTNLLRCTSRPPLTKTILGSYLTGFTDTIAFLPNTVSIAQGRISATWGPIWEGLTSTWYIYKLKKN